MYLDKHCFIGIRRPINNLEQKRFWRKNAQNIFFLAHLCEMRDKFMQYYYDYSRLFVVLLLSIKICARKMYTCYCFAKGSVAIFKDYQEHFTVNCSRSIICKTIENDVYCFSFLRIEEQMFCKNKDKISTKRNIFTFYVFFYLLTNVYVSFLFVILLFVFIILYLLFILLEKRQCY